MPSAPTRREPYGPVIVAGAIGFGATAAVAVIPGLRFAYESSELHVGLESAQGIVAMLLAYLTFGRLRLTHRRQDLLLSVAFAAFAATNLFVSALPMAITGENVDFITWMAAGLRVAAAGVLAAAALAPDRLVSEHRLVSRVVGSAAAIIALVVILAALADSVLADLVDPTLSPDASSRPLLAGHAAAVAIQVISTTLTAAAAAAFMGRAVRTKDDLLRWLAAGATLGAFARLNYVLFPSLYTEWFYTGDVLRLGSYLLFLVGAAREIGSYWRGQAEQAVTEERRRMARELHDGLAQELSFIRSQLGSGTDVRPQVLPFVADAADRALAESRRAIDTLTGSRDTESLGSALRSAAGEVAGREDVDVVLEDESGGVLIEPAVHVALERIVREAAVNAIRHGEASRVTVSLHASGSVVTVRVIDDGAGFDVRAKSSRRGFGLVSMLERCEHVNGSFHVESEPGRGTVIEVAVPTRT